MNPNCRKFISLFLVFSLMMLSVNLYAKKRGAELIITKKDGIIFQGELITVKQNSLLILVPEGKDVSFDISDIFSIRIMKKSKAGLGVALGALTGLVFALSSNDSIKPFGILVDALIGGIIGYFIGKDKTILIGGMTGSEIQKTLNKLRKKARIRKYK